MRVSLNLSTEEAEALQQLAKRRHRTVSGEVTDAVVRLLWEAGSGDPETPLEAVPDDQDPF